MKLEETFVDRLVKVVVEPTLVAEIPERGWDSKELTLTTPREAENERLKAYEAVAWYNNVFDKYTPSGEKAGGKRAYTPQKYIYKIGDADSFATLNVGGGN